jgi:hypothetical protein
MLSSLTEEGKQHRDDEEALTVTPETDCGAVSNPHY